MSAMMRVSVVSVGSWFRSVVVLRGRLLVRLGIG